MKNNYWCVFFLALAAILPHKSFGPFSVIYEDIPGIAFVPFIAWWWFIISPIKLIYDFIIKTIKFYKEKLRNIALLCQSQFSEH